MGQSQSDTRRQRGHEIGLPISDGASHQITNLPMPAFPHFQYQPLESSHHIRLVTLEQGPDISAPIRCSIAHHKLGSVRYEALSYEWGLPATSDPEISIDGHPLRVRRNLRDALLYIRAQDRDRYLWVDALCIDQENGRERNHQVSIMGRIFNQAYQVVVWLGLATNSSERAMHIIERLYHGSSDFDQLRPDILHDIHALCSRSYWQRLWIIQEIYLAKELQIYCGYDNVRGKAFEAFCLACSNYQLFEHADLVSQIRQSIALDAHMAKRVNRLRDYKSVSMQGHIDFQAWLQVAVERDFLCSEPRDIIYALLGLSPSMEEINILPDYEKPIAEVLVDALVVCESTPMELRQEIRGHISGHGFAHTLAHRMGILSGNSDLVLELYKTARNRARDLHSAPRGYRGHSELGAYDSHIEPEYSLW
ncbi:heterokaryon incompatibility protein-domain-containing protein [Cadophora sp. MPI-SDFR-AT-0126]|nr:heterokaryon incompatibility protein-domain-containing protein [Leotiomycetes sp. MPI-SDFR-AT-0126]